MATNKAVMDLDKNLMMAYLREREAFGWAMSADAASRDHQHASETWTEYAHTALAARQEVEELEKELEATIAALHSRNDDLQQARQVIQALLITATCTDLPTADAAAVRQAVAFLGGTSE